MLSTENSEIWNDDRINRILESTKFAVWSLSLKDRVFYLSKQCKTLLEIPETLTLQLEDLRDYFASENFSYEFSNFKKSWKAGTYDATLKALTFKKNQIWLHVHSLTEFDSDGRPELIYGILNDVTELKQQEVGLREQKMELERVHRLLGKTEEVGKLGHWIYDRKSAIFNLSRETMNICKVGTDSFLSKEEFYSYINPKTLNWPCEKPPQPGTYVHEISAGGEKKWVEVNVDATYEDSETIFGTIQDITYEVSLKRKALNDEARQKAIINTMPNAFFYTDTNGIIRQVNQAFSQMVGSSRHQLVGTYIYNCLHFEDIESVFIRDKLLLNGQKETMDYQTRIRRGKEIMTIRLYKSTFQNTAGKMLGFIGVIFDLSHEIRKSAQLKLYNKQLNLAIGGANAGFFTYDIQKDLNYWDEKTSQMFGFSREAHIGPFAEFLRVLHPEDRERVYKQKKLDYQGVERIDEHYRIIRKGRVRYINAQGVVERDIEGKPVKILGIHFDETERILAQKNLIASEKKYRRIFENIRDGYLLIELDGKIINANPASASLLGYKNPEALIGKHLNELCAEDQITVEQLKTELAKGSYLNNVKINMLRRNGQQIIADFNIHLNKYEGTTIIEATFRDVTQEVQTQERILKATIKAEDSQKQRIAQTLHDSVQQLLIISKMNFESIREVIRTLPEHQAKRFELGLKFLNDGLNETRYVSHELMPSSAEDFGLSNMMENFVNYLNLSSEITFHYDSNTKNKSFDKQVEVSLYRILQEASSNILKHSKATTAHIQLRVSKGKLTFTIEDNGVGFKSKAALNEKSVGITGMRNRATSIGAYFEVESKKGQGTILLVEVPV